MPARLSPFFYLRTLRHKGLGETFMRTSYDVTIIGAGLAGLQCARLLARQGLNVLLVDRKNTLDQKIHTTGIFVRRTLVDFDIPDDCLGPPIKHVTLYSPAHRSLELVSQHDEFRIGRMGQLYQRYLQQCLHSGVHWLPQTSYLSHSAANGKLTLRLSSGSTMRSITTRYLIGADGARSRVARDLKLELNREWIVGVESVFHGAVLDGPPRLLCFLDPKLAPGYIAWIAYDGEETHLGVGGYPSLFDPTSALQDFRSRVADIIDLRNAKQIETRAGLIPVGGVLKNIANSTGTVNRRRRRRRVTTHRGRFGSLHASVRVRRKYCYRVFVDWRCSGVAGVLR